MKFIRFFLLFLLFIKSALAQEKIAKKPVVVTSINPIYQILLAITQDQKNSFVIINPNISEHDYQLKQSDIPTIMKADLVFYIDDNLEHSFAKVVKGKKNSFQLSKINEIKLLSQKDNSKRTDLHLWLNPENGIKIAEFITQKLCEIDQIRCENYQKNLGNFKKETELETLFAKKDLSLIKSSNYAFYHDSYQYFEDYFSLQPTKIVAKRHDSELTVREARKFFEVSKKMTIKCLFSDFADSGNSSQKLALNYNMKFVELDFMGINQTYPKMISNMAKNITDCLASE